MQNLVKIICLAVLNISLVFAQVSNNTNVTVNISNRNKSCKVIFEDIPSGIYAISFYHDENDNNKMDTNFLGIS